jgi:hypothetical protein
MYNPTALTENMRPKPLFPVNMWNLNTLFPGFAAGDLAVLHGSTSVLSLCSLLCVRAQLPTQLGGLATNVGFIDGANTFQLYQITRLAKLHQLDPKQVLDHIIIARAFTAYQMTTLIMQKLEETITKHNTKLAIISDIAATFLDKDIQDEEAKKIYSQITAKLSAITKKHQTIIIVTYPPHQDTRRNIYLQTLTQATANVVLNLHRSKYTREIILEKHPTYTLGSTELPTETVQLTHFMEA